MSSLAGYGDFPLTAKNQRIELPIQILGAIAVYTSMHEYMECSRIDSSFFRNTTYIPRFFFEPTHSQGLVNVPIEHHPTIGDIITKQILVLVMFKILKTGHLPQDGAPQ